MLKRILHFLDSNILISAIFIATVLGFVLPDLGKMLYDLNFIPVLIFTVFLCQGTAVDSSKLKEWRHYVKSLCLGFTVSQIISPLLAWGLMQFVSWQDDYVVGFLLISCMAPTLVSGTVLTQQAKGDVTLSIVLTVTINVLAVLALPINLKLVLGEVVEIPTEDLFKKLFFYVFIPSVLGYFWRRKKEAWIKSKKVYIKYTPIVCLSLPIFMSTSKQVEKIKSSINLNSFFSFSSLALVQHLSLFCIAYFVSSRLLNLSKARCQALAIVSSQKTIPITIAVWSSVFAEAYPMALIPPIIFHFAQIYCDGLIASRWGRG